MALNVCQELKFSKDLCWPLKREWNNAAFAAILTYESRGAVIAELHQKQKSNLKDFYQFLQKQYDIFKKRNTYRNRKYFSKRRNFIGRGSYFSENYFFQRFNRFV